MPLKDRRSPHSLVIASGMLEWLSLKPFLDRGVDPNAFVYREGGRTYRALSYAAAYSRDAEPVELLLGAKADVKLADTLEEEPRKSHGRAQAKLVQLAACNRLQSDNVIKLLLAAGADPCHDPKGLEFLPLSDVDGYHAIGTPLVFCLKYAWGFNLQLLLDAGYDAHNSLILAPVNERGETMSPKVRNHPPTLLLLSVSLFLSPEAGSGQFIFLSSAPPLLSQDIDPTDPKSDVIWTSPIFPLVFYIGTNDQEQSALIQSLLLHGASPDGPAIPVSQQPPPLSPFFDV